MSGMAGRALRIRYNDGSGAVAISGSTSDTFTVTKEGIEVTDKDDLGVRRFIDDAVGTWAMDGGIEGVLHDTRLIELANNTTQFTGSFEVLIGGLGTYVGNFGLSSLEHTGAEGAEAITFSASLQSSGNIVFTAA